MERIIIISVLFVSIMSLTSCKLNYEIENTENLIISLASKYDIELNIDVSKDASNSITVHSIGEFENLIVHFEQLELGSPLLIITKNYPNSVLKGSPCPNLSGLQSIRQPLLSGVSSGVGLAHAADMYIQPTIIHNVLFSNGQVVDSNSELLGITIGISYNSGLTAVNYAPNGNVIVEFTGYLNWNIVFEGVGTVYRRKVSTIFEFECNI